MADVNRACRSLRLRELSPAELSVTPATMARIGTIDERYQSYNIEMVEVTGGEFWKPYGPERGVKAAPPPNTPGASNSNNNSNLFQYRPPIDLTNARLRKLASALAPAYLGSAAPGQTPPISRIRTARLPRPRRDSKAF